MKVSRVECSLLPEERLLAAAIRTAIRDATRAKETKVRTEAAAFVWTVSPTIAERACVPHVDVDEWVVGEVTQE